MVQSLTCLILKKKNSLSKIWLAAHWDKKLTRYHILQIDIERCIRDIIHQEIILDLRLSGHLLVGIVKIFSRKTMYLLSECTDIISQVRVFQPGMIELSPRKLTVPMKSITLPELFEFNKPDEDEIFNSLQSHIEDITLKETIYDTRLIKDDEHFDVFGEENIPMDFEENFQLASLLNDGGEKANHEIQKDAEVISVAEYCNEIETGNGTHDSSDSLPGDRRGHHISDSQELISERHISDSQELISGRHHISDSQELISGRHHISDSQELISLWLPDKIRKPKDSKLNLEPLSNNFYNIQRSKKQKRKLIVDEVKSISREKFGKQFQEFSDLVVPLDLAPPSKRLMILKEVGSVEELLHQPGMKITSTEVQNVFKKNLRRLQNEEIVDDSTSDEDLDFSIPIESHCRKLFLDGCAFASGFDEQNFLPHELNNQHELLNENALPENSMNYDSPVNDFGDFNEQRNSLSQDIQLSIEIQQDSGCSSNGISSICQDKIIKLLQKLKLLFKDTKDIQFSDIVETYKKIKVAQTFHSMLMIKKYNIVEIKQAEPYGEIFLTKGANFVVACEDIY